MKNEINRTVKNILSYIQTGRLVSLLLIKPHGHNTCKSLLPCLNRSRVGNSARGRGENRPDRHGYGQVIPPAGRRRVKSLTCGYTRYLYNKVAQQNIVAQPNKKTLTPPQSHCTAPLPNLPVTRLGVLSSLSDSLRPARFSLSPTLSLAVHARKRAWRLRPAAHGSCCIPISPNAGDVFCSCFAAVTGCGG